MLCAAESEVAVHERLRSALAGCDHPNICGFVTWFCDQASGERLLAVLSLFV